MAAAAAAVTAFLCAPSAVICAMTRSRPCTTRFGVCTAAAALTACAGRVKVCRALAELIRNPAELEKLRAVRANPAALKLAVEDTRRRHFPAVPEGRRTQPSVEPIGPAVIGAAQSRLTLDRAGEDR